MPRQQQPRPTRELIVTGQTAIKHGTSNGRPWTLYKVTATTPDGGPVREKLTTFRELPVGQRQIYVIDRKDHPQYGTSFTLSLPQQGIGHRVEALEGQVAELIRRVDALADGQTNLLPGMSGVGGPGRRRAA
jgi:hypothetical protein